MLVGFANFTPAIRRNYVHPYMHNCLAYTVLCMSLSRRRITQPERAALQASAQSWDASGVACPFMNGISNSEEGDDVEPGKVKTFTMLCVFLAVFWTDEKLSHFAVSGESEGGLEESIFLAVRCPSLCCCIPV